MIEFYTAFFVPFCALIAVAEGNARDLYQRPCWTLNKIFVPLKQLHSDCVYSPPCPSSGSRYYWIRLKFLWQEFHYRSCLEEGEAAYEHHHLHRSYVHCKCRNQ